MGHRSIQMTCRYAHLAPSVELEAVDGMAESWQAKVAKAAEQRTRQPAQSVILEALPDQFGDAQSGSTDTKTSTSRLERF